MRAFCDTYATADGGYVALATGDDRPMDAVIMYMFSRIARNMRLFFNTVGDFRDAGVEVISIIEDFGQGRGKRLDASFRR